MTVDDYRREFLLIHREWLSRLERIADDRLYRRADPRSLSAGEELLRSAAALEQVAGGITTRLWDDPFEWTLPEKLSDKRSIASYFEEVESAFERALGFLASDADLEREIPAPTDLKRIGDVLAAALSASRQHLEAAKQAAAAV